MHGEVMVGEIIGEAGVLFGFVRVDDCFFGNAFTKDRVVGAAPGAQDLNKGSVSRQKGA